VAAALVFFYHFPPDLPAPWSALASEGHVGVTVFFVLSGFLITARYGERFADGRGSLREYFGKRVARILPLYWTVLGLSLLLSTGTLGLEWTRLPEWTVTQALLEDSVHDLVVPTSWSLTVEECFYALAPLLFLSLGAARRRFPARSEASLALVLALWVAGLYLLGRGLNVLLPPDGPGFLVRLNALTTHTVFGRFFDFAVGAACAVAWPRFRVVEAQRRGRAGLATPLAIGGALAFQIAAWGAVAIHASAGPVRLEEAMAVVPPHDRLVMDTREMREAKDEVTRLAAIPRGWREGWGDDVRAPSGLRVYADGEPLAFSRQEPENGREGAFYRGPRAELLAVRTEEPAASIAVIRERPYATGAILASRLTAEPLASLALAAATLVTLVSARRAFRRRAVSARTAVSLALGAAFAWVWFEAVAIAWAPALIAVEALLALVLLPRASAEARPPAEPPRWAPAGPR
jgi:hypothetical protein